jgi:5-(carboxyamino)imidazole ribonucleotide synthase
MNPAADPSRPTGPAPVAPGGTLGILGGGQLGRMMAMAAARLGYRVHVYAPPGEDAVAAGVAAEATRADYADTAALARFAAACDVVTYEFENVPVAPLAALGTTPLRPPARALEVTQDRAAEKTFVEELGARVAPWRPVDDAAGLAAALADLGTPAVLKTRRFGYDGKGQARIMAPGDAAAAWQAIGGRPAIVEAMVDFAGEFSVILARGQDGAIAYWDSPLNVHAGGILRQSTVPLPADIAGQVPAARIIAGDIADALGHVGVLTVEYFACADGPLVNEIAPRVHNSGHWTIEGAVTSQFANHVRAVLGLPLGATRRLAAAVEMRNLIGADAGDWAALLADPDAALHLYGKAECRDGRKMGHVTRLSA